jgi:hypothetical protein
MRHLIILAFTGIGFLNSALSQTSDSQLWTGFKANYTLNKKLKAYGEQQFRFNDGMTTFNRTFTEVGMSWRFAKRFSLRPNYRFSIDPNGFNSHRFSGDLIYSSKKKKKTVRFKNRLRYQRKIEVQTFDPTTYIRNKFTVDINASKLVDPYLFGEAFFRLDGRNEFRTWRSGFGLDWKLSKKWELTTFYIYEQEINRNSNDRVHIIGALVSWDIN